MSNLKAKVICAGNCPICNKPLKEGECIFMCNECKIKNEKLMELENQKTGHWIRYNDKGLWECSECGELIYSETEQDRKEKHKYCNRCGAKMKGENNE